MEYSIAFREKNGRGYTDNCPYIVMPPFGDLNSCQRDADAMIKAGYQDVTVFKVMSSLESLLKTATVAWDYVKRNKVRCAGAGVDIYRYGRIRRSL